MIEINNLSKVYKRRDGDLKALDNVSFKVAPGRFAVVRGPSGCGKTTLLQILGALMRPTSGEVLIDHRNPCALSLEERAAFRSGTIGFVFQQFHLVPYLTALDNVMVPTLGRSSKKQSRRRGEELLERFGLTDRKNHRPADLSVGERQRCALARALMNEPKILLADEPTGNLDPDNGKLVIEAIRAFTGDGGSALMVTHDDAAESLADEVIRLEKGRMV